MPHLVAPGGLPPAAEKAFLGVALRPSDPPGMLHVGLVYRKKASDEARLSHLETHERLLDVAFPGVNFHWQAFQLDSLLRPSVVAFLNHLRRTLPTPRVPYGFKRLGCAFVLDKSSHQVHFVAGPPGHGLTCATFVVCVFESLHIPFVLASTWPLGRPGDREFRDWMIANFMSKEATVEQARAMQGAGFDARIRPEDVASAAIQPGHPLGYDAVEVIAREIREQLIG